MRRLAAGAVAQRTAAHRPRRSRAGFEARVAEQLAAATAATAGVPGRLEADAGKALVGVEHHVVGARLRGCERAAFAVAGEVRTAVVARKRRRGTELHVQVRI